MFKGAAFALSLAFYSSAANAQIDFQTTKEVEEYAATHGLSYQRVRLLSDCYKIEGATAKLQKIRIYFDNEYGIAVDCYAPSRPTPRPLNRN